jgi:hypothetical protein
VGQKYRVEKPPPGIAIQSLEVISKTGGVTPALAAQVQVLRASVTSEAICFFNGRLPRRHTVLRPVQGKTAARNDTSKGIFETSSNNCSLISTH